jgi:hypothetical protein
VIPERIHKAPADSKAYISVPLLWYICAEFARFVSDTINICSSTRNKFRYIRWEIIENLRDNNL